MKKIIVLILAALAVACSAQRFYTFAGERPPYLICERFEHCKAWNIRNNWNLHFYDLEKCSPELHLKGDVETSISQLRQAEKKLSQLMDK